MVGACRSVHALSIHDWASLVCLPEPEVPRYVSARGKFPESLILGRLVEQSCLVCLPVSGSLYFLCRVNGGSWDRPVSVDAILSCCALHNRRVLRLCDSENVRQPLFSSERLQTIKSNFSIVGPFLLALVAAAVFWWFGVATAALKTVLGLQMR